MSRNKLKQDNTPIIFIHFNDSGYLEYTLKSALKFNPDKRIILLGDKSNEYYKKLGIEYYYFKDFEGSEEVKIFDKVYKFIAGSSQRKQPWTKFVFKRWFYMYNFIKQNDIQSFWTFDSDTLIFSDLSRYEKQFSETDCTSQCNGNCMNGYIANQKVVKNYLDKINELFQRPDYLKKQQEEMKQNPDWAFTEMRAFATFEKENNPGVFRLNKIINNETFDECICQEDGMETEKKFGRTIKKLYFKNGKIYTKEKSSGNLIKINTLNMSWVPTLFIAKVYYYGVNGKHAPFYYPLVYNFKKLIRVSRRKLK